MVLHESLLVLFLCMVVIRVEEMDKLRGLLGIRRMDKVPNARIRELYGVTKELDEKIDEGVL